MPAGSAQRVRRRVGAGPVAEAYSRRRDVHRHCSGADRGYTLGGGHQGAEHARDQSEGVVHEVVQGMRPRRGGSRAPSTRCSAPPSPPTAVIERAGAQVARSPRTASAISCTWRDENSRTTTAVRRAVAVETARAAHASGARAHHAPDGAMDHSTRTRSTRASSSPSAAWTRVIVAFLFSFLDDDTHEQRAKEIVSSILADAFVSCSSDVVNTIREYELSASAAMNAYMSRRPPPISGSSRRPASRTASTPWCGNGGRTAASRPSRSRASCRSACSWGLPAVSSGGIGPALQQQQHHHRHRRRVGRHRR